VGAGAFASNGAAAFGDGAVATGTNATAVGPGASANFANSSAFGAGASATAANQMAFGTASNTYRMPGITSAASLAAQSGSTSFVTTDANGNLAATSFGPQAMLQSVQTMSAAFQSQINGLQAQINDNNREARRGIAAAVATPSAPMPSLPGRTTWQVRTSTFLNEYGAGFAFSHRLNTRMPLAFVGGYGNGGGRDHTGYIGLGGEF
jgi:trimeric autotransporter adhesin